MKRHKIILHMLKNRGLQFWTTINIEIKYFLNEETEGILTDTVMDFHDWHLPWLSQLNPNVKACGIMLRRVSPLTQA